MKSIQYKDEETGKPTTVLDCLAPIHTILYRMKTYWNSKSPKINILVAWLLMFTGSLEYQLNPFLPNTAEGRLKMSATNNYKSGEFYDSQVKLEQLLASHFEFVLRTLIFRYGFEEFNPKDCLLSLLFNKTSQYDILQ